MITDADTPGGGQTLAEVSAMGATQARVGGGSDSGGGNQ